MSALTSPLPYPEKPALSMAQSLARYWPQWLEVLSVFAAIEAVLWTEGRTRATLYILANIWVFAMALRHRRSARQLGLSRHGLRESAWLVLAGAAVALAIIGIGALHGTLHPLFGSRPAIPRIAAYSLWALMQQFIVQSYFFVQIESLTGSGRKAVIGSALLFGLAHIPNPVLFTVTTIGGFVFCELFRRYRNIYTLAITHTMVALSIAVSLPDDVHRHMRVGIGYIKFKKPEKPTVPIGPPSESAPIYGTDSGK